MIKVLLADDHQIVTDGIQSFLKEEPDIQVVGVARHGKEVLEILDRQAVDVAVLDISMPQLDGVETTQIITRQYPQTRVLILTIHNEGEFILNLLRIGAFGYLLKEKSKEALVGAIHSVYRGNRYFPPSIIDKIPATYQKKEEEVYLTVREKEMLCLLAEAPSYKEIADLLNIAEVTVHTHVRNIKKKLGFHTKGELIKYAIEHDICA